MRSLPLGKFSLHDYLLSAPPGADQIIPWIAVDKRGGINVLNYETLGDDQERNPGIDAYYVYIPNFSPSISQPVYRYRLTPSSFTFNVGPLPNIQTLGEYQLIVTSGCYAEVGYMSTHEGQYNFYVRRIFIKAACLANHNADSAVNPLDLEAYMNSYASQEQSADADANGTVNVIDVAEFISAYTSLVPPG